jgi:glycosyltransferase involved in cell wall biosynthesis
MTNDSTPRVANAHVAGPTTLEPLVSVILPVYNGEADIETTLDSALQQTYRNIEVIIVDDGSRDGTRALVDALARRDSRVRVVAQTNRGVAAARNRGLAEARGQFIAPLDADDVWDPTKIERQVDRIRETGDNTGLVYCWWVWIDDNGAVLDCSPRWRIEGNAAETLLQVNYTGNASVPLYRRRDLEQVGGFDVTLRDRGAQGCEDWDVALKIVERSSVAVVPSVLVGYRRRRASMSTRTDRMWRSHVLVVNGATKRQPALSPSSIRRSHDQFALHLAGVSFWSRAYVRSICWGLRASRSSLVLHVLPYVIRLFSRMLVRPRHSSRKIVRPGVRFSSWDMPRSLIPYDRIYDRHFTRLRDE